MISRDKYSIQCFIAAMETSGNNIHLCTSSHPEDKL